ncbi:MAG: glucosaminidase domain-containing protein [Acidaminococcaceae bacterium]|jgi:hypothetical protein|nr:glucosaminidase domain-containing protein [Acidaminococcaceae bacterium]
MMINYRKLMLALLVGASVLATATPVLARSNGASVLTPEEQAFTRSRQSGVKYVAVEQTAPAQEVESLESKAAAKAAKHHKHKKQQQEAQLEPEYNTPAAPEKTSSRKRKKSAERGSVLSPEEQEFTRERQAGLTKAVEQPEPVRQAPAVSQPSAAAQSPWAQAAATRTKSGRKPAAPLSWEEQADREVAADKRAKRIQGPQVVPETPAGYKPQFLLPGNYQEVTIFGPALATEAQAVGLLKIINPQPKLTCTPAEIVHYYWQEAGREGIRPDVAFAQAILESGSFRFGGDVLPSQNNFCGLGTVGGGVKGATFKTPELGARAHIQHLLAYTSKRPHGKIVDPRYELAHKVRLRDGLCTTWYQLNGNWATSKYYAEKILTVWQRMLGYKDLGGVPVQSDVLAYGRLGK